MTPPTAPPQNAIDPALIAGIVRRVIAQLQSKSATHVVANDSPQIADSVVSVESLRSVAEGEASVTVSATAVITPAAIDEAKERGLLIKRMCATLATKQQSTVPASTGVKSNSVSSDSAKSNAGSNIVASSLSVTDTCDCDRGQAVLAQLGRRGVQTLGGRQVLLSDRPAATAIRQTQLGFAAVVLRSFADVDRFTKETDASVFVIDMIDVNFVSAVNMIVRLSQTANNSQMSSNNSASNNSPGAN